MNLLRKAQCSDLFYRKSALGFQQRFEQRFKSIPERPSRTKTLWDSESLCRSVCTTPPPPHIYYAVNPSLREEIPVKPSKSMSAQGGRDGKSLCNSFLWRIILVQRGFLGEDNLGALRVSEVRFYCKGFGRGFGVWLIGELG